MSHCVICQHSTDRYACNKCQRRISDHLSDIVNYAALAENELLPGRGGDGRSTERSLGIRLQALDLVSGHTVLPILESWERMFREEWGYAPWGPTSLERGQGKPDQATAYLTGTVAFLRANLDRICEHAAVDDFHHEVTKCYYEARSAANHQPRQAWRVNCPADIEGAECGHSLRITGQDIDNDIRCRACGSDWNLRRLLLVAIASGVPIWVDLETAADYFAVHPGTLRKWAKAEQIKRSGSQYDFNSIYRYVELSKDLKAAASDLT
jgi:hypothetical protein